MQILQEMLKFDASKCEVEEPLSIRKNVEVIGLNKNELDGKIIKEFAEDKLRPKMYSCLTDDDYVDKRKKTQESVY